MFPDPQDPKNSSPPQNTPSQQGGGSKKTRDFSDGIEAIDQLTSNLNNLTAKDAEVNLKIIEALENAVRDGPWDKSPFLKATGKKLEEIRDRFKDEIEAGIASSAEKVPIQTSQLAMQESKTLEVYISLYVSGGSEMKNWEGVLSSIYGYSITRPIYKHEDDIVKVLRSKGNVENDAYAGVVIREDDLREVTDTPPKDRFGNELLLVKEGAISPDNVFKFVHMGGEYDFKEGRLARRQ